MTYTWRRKGPVKPRPNEDAGLAICRTMIEDFIREVTDNAMRSVATVMGSAGLGDSVRRLDQPMQRQIVENLAARLAAGAEAEIFDREWVGFFAPPKPRDKASPDRRVQVLQILKDMAEARKADLPARPDPMATLCAAAFEAGKHGLAIDAITERTVKAVLKACKGGRKGGFRDPQELRYAVKDQAIGLFLEMENPDLFKLGVFMRVTVHEWVLLVLSGAIR